MRDKKKTVEFFDTPNRIRHLRKQFFMKQYELSSEHITTAFVSMIELGKRGVSEQTAARIAEKLNEGARRRGFEVDIDAAYLLLSPEEEAEKYCLDQLQNMKEIEGVEELLSICKQYKLAGVESKIHSFIGDKLYDEGKHEKAYLEYSLAVDLCKGTAYQDMQPYLYNRCGLCKWRSFLCEEASFCYERAIHYAKMFNNEDIKQKAYHNIASCYYYLGNYEEAIKEIDNFIDLIDKENLDTYLPVLILKGNCYKDKGELDTALGVYNSILEQYESKLTPHLLGKIYTNVAGVYLDKKSYVESLEYYNKAQKIRKEHDKYGLAFTMVEKAQIYVRQGFYDDAVIMIELALETAETYCNEECMLKGYLLLKEIYTRNNDIEGLKKVYEKLTQLLKHTDKENEFLKMAQELSLLHLNSGDVEKTKECLEMVVKSYDNESN